MTRRRSRSRPSLVLTTVVVAGGAVGLAGVALGLGPATAQTGCMEYGALAAADGVRTLASAPGSSPTDVDGQGPAAQAEADSVAGSRGFAGVPFSNAAAGNAGAGGVDATQVPVFAISEYPSRPSASSSTPAASVESKSEERSSNAKASAGGPGDEQAAAGRATATADASCADDGTIKAVGDSVAQMIDVGGVLRIAFVRSTATATVTPSGERTLDGKLSVEGVTVAGQTVGVGDKGIVVGSTPTALPADNPLAQALTDAGIAVRTVGVVKDDKDGDVIAPALEITVTRPISGVGTGPVTTTYTFGRAYARATATPGEPAVSDADAPVDGGVAPEVLGPDALAPPAVGDGSLALGSTGADLAPSVSRPGGSGDGEAGASSGTPGVLVPAQRIATTSSASLYPAVALGALVLAAAGVVFRFLGVRLRWN